MFALQNWVESDKFAARPAAQARLQSFAKEEPNGPLKLFGFGPQKDVTVVEAVLCDVVQWGKPLILLLGNGEPQCLSIVLFSFSSLQVLV